MSKREKKMLTAEQLYKHNQVKSKVLKRLSPIIFWSFLILSIMFFVLMIRNSVGNITEIMDMLDKSKLTGEEIQNNYAYLVDKWGEWVIVGESGGLFKIQFIDIRKAFFSGLMITFLILGFICLGIAIIVGKIILPKLSDYYTTNNQDMVNLATLQTNAEITKSKTSKSKEDWF